MIAARTSTARRRLLPGDASAFFTHGVGAGDRVVLLLRVSHCKQEPAKKFRDAERQLRAYCAEVGAVVVDVVRINGSGWWTEPRAWLELQRAFDLARQHDATILAESTDRFVRHPAYHSAARPYAQARDCDLRRLTADAGGVRLATMLDPNASASDIRSHQTKRGLPQMKAGYKKARRAEQRPQVIERWRQGATLGDLAKEFGVAKSTIADWLKDVEQHPTPPLPPPRELADCPHVDLDELIKRWRGGTVKTKLARDYGVHQRDIRHWLRGVAWTDTPDPPSPDELPPLPTAADYDGDWWPYDDDPDNWHPAWVAEKRRWFWTTGPSSGKYEP